MSPKLGLQPQWRYIALLAMTIMKILLILGRHRLNVDKLKEIKILTGRNACEYQANSSKSLNHHFLEQILGKCRILK